MHDVLKFVGHLLMCWFSGPPRQQCTRKLSIALPMRAVSICTHVCMGYSHRIGCRFHDAYSTPHSLHACSVAQAAGSGGTGYRVHFHATECNKTQRGMLL